MKRVKTERTDRWSGVCNGFVSAIFVALIRTIRLAVAPVDTLDALVPGDTFELGRCAFPFCLLGGRLCRSRNTQEQRIHIYIYTSRYVDNENVVLYKGKGISFCSGGQGWSFIEEESIFFRNKIEIFLHLCVILGKYLIDAVTRTTAIFIYSFWFH